MPPHCDSLDGPVAQAAARALDTNDVDLVLPFVRPDGENEVRLAFDLAMRARAAGGDARTVADQWFFETAIRVHRAGEGAAFTGMKPAGLDVGPVIPVAEASIAAGDPEPLATLLAEAAREQVLARFATMVDARKAADASGGVEAERAYVDAMLGLEVWSHRLYKQMVGPAHG